ncbi:MAG TPA: trehalose-6-phosphate synthase [Terriglobales bacterium]|nr:trehalose-6-phosphate synthase [Terriglobales bacterium]
MRLLSVRLIVSLVLGIAAVSFLFSSYEVQVQKRNLHKDLEHRAEVLAESLAGNVEGYLDKGSRRDLERFVSRFGNRENLIGLAVYDAKGTALAMTPALAQYFAVTPSFLLQSVTEDRGVSQFQRLNGAPLQSYAQPLHHEGQVSGGLMIVYDSSYINALSRHFWWQTFLRVLAQMAVITLVTLLIVRWSLKGPIARAAQWMRALRMGKDSGPNAPPPDWDFLRPLAHEMKTFAESLNQARSAAETEARLRDAGESLWTAERLAVHVRSKLGESRIFVAANREPYMHQRQGKAVEVIVPASGLVTALEPILQACDGTWVAHGSGDADRETVDNHDRLRVPPEDARYTLRRVWLDKDEEQGYYYGFANEGLWPLCHIAHTRPIFRASDWDYYQQVNRKFAEAVVKEMEGVERPLLLAQDYHFALLPRLVKLRRPDARVAIFWHIPWPNPEAFGICPWQRVLLDGLLGADLVGFHVQSHCNNFLATVDRALESRVDWEHFSVRRFGHLTMVRPFPISVDFTESEPREEAHVAIHAERPALLRELGIESMFLGVGVDRVDYTKGILERFQAVELFLEKYPSYVKQFTFVQIGAPSRTHIKRYHDFLAEVEAEAERINWRFQSGKWKPILFLKRQHSHQEIQRFYRAADVCMVTSLHDGMNLVAKEFLASRHDEQGTLILSRFTGAARELRDALLVNPYDIDQTAEAIHFALEMDDEERQLRMQRMRQSVKEHNIFRWAANLVAELSNIRLDTPGKSKEGARTPVPAA